MIRNADIQIVRGDAEVIVIPIRDLDSPTRTFIEPPDPANIRYVIATGFESDLIVFEPETEQIRVRDFGNVRPENPDLPPDFPALTEDQRVIRVELSPEDTRQLSVTVNTDVDPFVHECEITQTTATTRKVTVMQGTVDVLPSATAQPQNTS